MRICVWSFIPLNLLKSDFLSEITRGLSAGGSEAIYPAQVVVDVHQDYRGLPNTPPAIPQGEIQLFSRYIQAELIAHPEEYHL